MTQNTRQSKCEDRIKSELPSTMEDLRKLWDLHCEDSEAYDDNLGNMYEYGLSFNYVAPGTFDDQPEAYFRYQLSWGGPSDEFRIYADKVNDWQFAVYRIEYWFMDWFDGAKAILEGDDLQLVEEIFGSFFVDSGTANHQYEVAITA